MEGEFGELRRCQANYAPLSPLGFLTRAEKTYGESIALINGKISRRTWAQTAERCRRVASSLVEYHDIQRGDVISVLAPNVPARYEAHFAVRPVPMAGAIMNAITTRLDARANASILSNCNPKLFFVDHQYMALAKAALSYHDTHYHPGVIVINDDDPTGIMYEDLICNGNPHFHGVDVLDEFL